MIDWLADHGVLVDTALPRDARIVLHRSEPPHLVIAPGDVDLPELPSTTVALVGAFDGGGPLAVLDTVLAALDGRGVLRIGAALFDKARACLTRGGQRFALTATEARLLAYLCEHAGETVDRPTLLQQVWNLHPETNTRTVAVTVHRLRAKLEPDPSRPRHLVSVRGAGYRLDLREASAEGRASVERPPLLVGREQELGAVRDHLDEGARLIVLTGPGGVGKTAVALEVAARLEDEGWAPVLAPLATARNLSDVVGAVAQALGAAPLRTDPAGALPSLLATAGHSEGTLLVLDSAEHLLPLLEPLLAEALRRPTTCPVLLTSRVTPSRPLGPEIRIAPLLPDDAVELLAAHMERRGAEVDTGDRPALETLAGVSEGLPLALELTAAQAETRAPRELVSDLLAQGGALQDADRERRHQSMAQCVRWSWGLLDEQQRDALCRLAIAPGSLDLHSARTLLGGAGGEVLQSLCQASLVEVSSDVPPRYRLRREVRDYAREVSASAGGDEDLARRFTRHFADLARATNAHLWHSESEHATAVLFEEFDNFAGALEHATSIEAAHLTVALAGAYRRRGPLSGSIDQIDESLDRHADMPPLLRARLLRARAYACWYLGRHERALADGRESLRLAREAGAIPDVGLSLIVLGPLEPSVEDGERHFEAALAIAEREGDHLLAGRAWLNRGVLVSRTGAFDRAVTYLHEAIASFDAIDARRGRRQATANLGLALGYGGREAEAREVLEGLFDDGDSTLTTNRARAFRALLLHAAGELDAAWQTYDATSRVALRLGDLAVHAQSRAFQAAICLERGDPAGAAARLDDLRPLVAADELVEVRAFVLCARALCADALGEPEQGRELRADAEPTRSSVSPRMRPVLRAMGLDGPAGDAAPPASWMAVARRLREVAHPAPLTPP